MATGFLCSEMRTVSKLIGERFGYLRKGLLPSTSVSVDLEITDNVGEIFYKKCQAKTSSFGDLKFDETELQNLISTARPGRV